MSEYDADLAAPSGYSIGTWLRFMRDGRLVVGVVQYRNEITGYRLSGKWRYITDAGVVDSRDILEAR